METAKLPVRDTDPATSIAAAETIMPIRGKSQAAVLNCLKNCGPMTQEQLCERIMVDFSESRIRSACSELRRAGHIIADGTSTTKRGNEAIIWKAK